MRNNARNLMMVGFVLCATIAFGVLVFVVGVPTQTTGSSADPGFGFYSPDTIAVDLLSGSTDRQESALMTASYRSYSLSTDDISAFLTLICSGVAEENHQLFVGVASKAGGTEIETGAVRQLLRDNGQAAGQACSARGNLLAAGVLLKKDPRYARAIVIDGRGVDAVQVNREQLTEVAKSRGIEAQR